MNEERNTFTLTLLEATVTLYPADASGQPILDSPIWSGAAAEDVKLREQWLKVETRPTGARYPRKHALVAQYEISLGRVWALQEANPAGFSTDTNLYVLDLVWVDEDLGYWHRKTFYNVTISQRMLEGRGPDLGHTDAQEFDAEYLAPPTGGTGPVPDITSNLPLVVTWIGADGAAVPLYSYDPTSHAFSEITPGISAGRATLAYAPDQSGTFGISFASGGTKLTLQTDGTVVVTAVDQGAAGPALVPRLDFYYGLVRVASLTQTGTLFAASFTQASPTAGASEFQFFSNSTLGLVLAGPGATAIQFQTS